MATMKDVAKLANVSVATVSNYLNGTKNVGRGKRLHIEKAIKDLNYVLDPSAQLLKKGENRKIGVILPYMNMYYSTLYEGILRVIVEDNYKVELIITNDNSIIEQISIERMIKEKVAGIIVTTTQLKNYEIFTKLNFLNIPFLLLEREIYSQNYNFCSFDNYDSIKKITKKLLKKKKQVFLIVGPQGYRTEDDCVLGFMSVLKSINESSDNKFILRTKLSEGSSFYTTINYLTLGNQIPNTIIVSSPIIAKGVLSALKTIHPMKKYSIICLGESISECFSDDSEIAYTPRDSFILGKKSAQLLIENIKSPIIFETKQVLLKDNEGLLSYFIENMDIDKKSSVLKEKDFIKVLTLEDPLSSSLRSIIPTFEAQFGVKIELEACKMSNYYDYLIKELKSENKPDMFLIDVPWIDYFVSSGQVEKLNNYLIEEEYYLETFIPKLLNSFGQSNNDYYALPYSYTNQLLFYRKDLFEDIALKKDFEDEYKMPLKPPRNWVEFNAIAKFFTKKYNASSPVEYGTTLAVAYPQAVAPEFLLRLWSFGGDIFDSKGKIIINDKSGKRAVENYCECFDYASPNSLINMPSDQIREFREGKAAMVIAFFSYGSDIIHSSGIVNEDNIGFSTVPGKNSVLSGWSFCISSDSKKKKTAANFLKWISGPKIAIRRAFLEGQSSQAHIYSSKELLRLYPWLDTALKSLEYTRKRIMPRINGKYLEPEKTVEDIIGEMIYSVLKDPDSLSMLLNECKEKLNNVIYKKSL